MKYIITEEQLDRVRDNILTVPYSAFNKDWDVLQKFLDKRGNPPYIIIGNVHLDDRNDIVSLGSLIEVRGNLNLRASSIESLGSLTSVGGYLDLSWTKISSFGNLSFVGGNLFSRKNPISKIYSLGEIRDLVEVKGGISI